jgi:lysozyme family protein
MSILTPFEKALAHTLGIEGAYSDHPNDSGGKTNYGITEAKARAWGYHGDMRQLPLKLAVQIYRVDYWDIIRLDMVAEISEPIALEMFDTGVNCGVSVPVKFLQRALNGFNRQATDYPDIAVDGLIGHNTLSALRLYLAHRGKVGGDVLVECLNSQQGMHYLTLAERRPKDEMFMYGWFANRVLTRSK